MEKPAGPQKPVVVFYDCCVPENHVQAISPELSFAEHIFVSKKFPRAVCGDDDELFSKIYELCQQDYPGSSIVFVTVDQNFLDEIQSNPAVGEILVIVLESVSNVSFETARERVRNGMRPVFDLPRHQNLDCFLRRPD